MLEHINIKITPDGSVFVAEHGVTVKQKQIDPQYLIQIINNSLEKSEVVDRYNSPVLPKNCIYYGVVERFASHPSQIVVVEKDKCIKPYNHLGDVINVGYPKLLFTYRIRGNEVIDSAVVAAIDEFIKNQSPIYRFPYGNVHSDGRICWGTFKYPRLNELADLSFYPEPLYLFEHTHTQNGAGQVISELLHKDREFDDSKLMLFTTFEKFIEYFTK